eukprot:CAMPEP_0197487280 /NCGR_PEP_ID=MMETSP1311-20131121/2317_1 /TAXON_ID=464262 /ORGANISM="Genus nov. species nov., Strain RCC856" /LENGTH=86 /DNA_ID=CAMNT_0043030877 /DNA_START=128 /DNA_END=385 /DNA_ORIENTATION=+
MSRKSQRDNSAGARASEGDDEAATDANPVPEAPRSGTVGSAGGASFGESHMRNDGLALRSEDAGAGGAAANRDLEAEAKAFGIALI